MGLVFQPRLRENIAIVVEILRNIRYNYGVGWEAQTEMEDAKMAKQSSPDVRQALISCRTFMPHLMGHHHK